MTTTTPEKEAELLLRLNAVVKWTGNNTLWSGGPFHTVHVLFGTDGSDMTEAPEALTKYDFQSLLDLISTEREGRERAEAEVERLSKSPWITEEGFKDAAELIDMGRVGQALVEAITDLRRSPGWEHWMPADGPAEIVFDLLNALADGSTELDMERQARQSAQAQISALQALIAEKDSKLAAVQELNKAGWFEDVADFLDNYTDAEIIDGTTHPNKALRILSKLQEAGL